MYYIHCLFSCILAYLSINITLAPAAYLSLYIACGRFLLVLFMWKKLLMSTSVCALNQQIPLIPGMVDGLGSQLLQRRHLYSGPMSKLRLLMICRMAKPEEVLIVEDENGNIVRETMKDNDVLVQYKVFNLSLRNKALNLCIYTCQYTFFL